MVEEGLQGEPQLRGELVFTKRTQKGDRLLIRAELDDAAGAALEVGLQLLLQRGWQLPFQVFHQKPDYGTAAAPTHELF